MAHRIYKVTIAGKERLVEGHNKASAVNHVARDTITAEVASQADLVRLVASGIKVETVGAEPARGNDSNHEGNAQ